MRTVVVRSGLLSLALMLVCSPGAWAGHRNASFSQTAPSVARAQGVVLQAAALSVAVGPGHQQQLRRQQARDLSRRSQARLPAWYKRAQAAQRHRDTGAVAAVRPGTQPQSGARVREPSGVPPRGSSVRKPARPQRQVSANAMGRSELVAVRSVRSSVESRGARHRRMVGESMQSDPTPAISGEASQSLSIDDKTMNVSVAVSDSTAASGLTSALGAAPGYRSTTGA
ncbi:MAG: hypothetical protein OXC07_03960, partial [Kistimonas sp.]|nr:hypothetical protein [Kistimonas sp.]